ncbi:MAG: hypothetical protein MAG581_00212 [Deltaproteobacteria bacterium]|nr:hypothetical protein [Deltaproteobacteria bacterium]
MINNDASILEAFMKMSDNIQIKKEFNPMYSFLK